MPAVNAMEILVPHHTWEVIDPTKLTTYMACPRKFFYNYVLGWKNSRPNQHLVFGSAWHLAVEHLLLNGYNATVVEEAKFILQTYYRSHFGPEMDADFAPKNPYYGFKALDIYLDKFRSDLFTYDVIYTEIAGTCLIAPDAPMFFKMDAMLRSKEDGLYWNLDHKTSTYKLSKWEQIWQNSTQIQTYMHSLYCLLPADQIGGGIVRGSFFYKSKSTEFHEAYLRNSPDDMQSWLEDTYYWYSALKSDMEALVECDDESPTMNAFQRNSTSCGDYGGCPYLEFCKTWSNPLRRCGDFIPDNMMVEFWDPRDLPEIKEFVDFTNIDTTKLGAINGNFGETQMDRPRETEIIIPGNDSRAGDPTGAAPSNFKRRGGLGSI